MKKQLKKLNGTQTGFTFNKEEREIYGLDEVGATYDIEIVKENNGFMGDKE